ncbi:transposase [Streptomyces bauhiniae]
MAAKIQRLNVAVRALAPSASGYMWYTSTTSARTSEPHRAPPGAPTRARSSGLREYPDQHDRDLLAGIVFVATSGCAWRQLPPAFGPCWQTVYRRFAQWSRARVWARLHRVVLDELGARGELDWSPCAIDSVSTRAAKKGGC